MSDPKIPPRPWRVVQGAYYENDVQKSMAVIVDADEQEFDIEERAGELIVRLVNAEPEIVAALEAAEAVYELVLDLDDCPASFEARLRMQLIDLRAALAKVRP